MQYSRTPTHCRSYEYVPAEGEGEGAAGAGAPAGALEPSWRPRRRRSGVAAAAAAHSRNVATRRGRAEILELPVERPPGTAVRTQKGHGETQLVT